MKLVDLATGPDWIVWIVFVIFAVTFYNFTFWTRKLVYFWI